MNHRPLTMTEKVLARAAGTSAVAPGDVVVTRPDALVVLDTAFSSSVMPWPEVQAVADPDKVSVILDHAVPAPTVRDANGGRSARAFVERFGIELHDVGAHGISHQVIAEKGLARPGELLLCSDSHTCAAGAFNCAARGVGSLDLLSAVCAGSTWFVVAPTIRVELSGLLDPMCDGKDAFLALAQRWGTASNANIEIGGKGLRALSVHDRRILATQCAEINADFVVCDFDEAIAEHFDRLGSPAEHPVVADPQAEYAAIWELDLTEVEPLVARPGGVVDRVAPVREVCDVRLDQCFVGSCANGQLEDFAAVAETVRGRHVAAGVRLIVTPASQQVYAQAVRAGYVETIVEAGGVVTNSTCGACWGYHLGVLGDHEVCLTASTRNFQGRMGSSTAEVYLASTRTVAASALAGHVVDPREALDAS